MQIEGTGPASVSIRDVGTLQFCNSNCTVTINIILKFKPNFKFFWVIFMISLETNALRGVHVCLPICDLVSEIKLYQIFMKFGTGCFAESFQASLCFMKIGFFTVILYLKA